MKMKIAAMLLLLLLVCGTAFAQTIDISPENASVFFQVTHDLGYTIGYFEDFKGTVELSDDKTQLLSAKAQVQTASINTRNPVRDEGLRSALFLDAEKFPQAAYENGSLTIKGITKPLAVKVDYDAARGKVVLKGVFNRNDYGITYNELLPSKKKSIGDMVELIVELNAK